VRPTQTRTRQALCTVRGHLEDKAASPHVQAMVEQRLVLVIAMMTAMEGQEAADALISDAVRTATTVSRLPTPFSSDVRT
jgi:hypothetical protein